MSEDIRSPKFESSLARNIVSSYLARGVTLLGGLIVFPFLAREVDLTMLGLWILLNSVTIFFTLDFGMSTALVRYVAESHAQGDHDGVNTYASSLLGLLAVVAVLGSVAFVVTMAIFEPRLRLPPSQASTAVLLMATVVVSTFLVSLPYSVFRSVIAGAQRYDLSNLLTVLQAALRVAAVVGALAAGYGIVGVAIAEAAVGIAVSTLGVVVCHKVVPELRISFRNMSVTALRQMAPFAGRVFVIQVAAIVILQTDSVVIGAVLSTSAIALYNGAFRLYQLCRELTNCFTAPLVPDASRRAVLAGRHDLGSVLVRGTKYANALVLLPAVPLLVFGREVLVAWAGDAFAPMADVLQVLLIGLLANTNHLVAVSLMTGIGAIKEYARYHVAWAVANLFLSIVLAQRFGLVGVALGTTIPVVLLEPLYVRAAVRAFGVPLRAFLGSALARVGVPAAIAVVPWAALVAAKPPQGLAGSLGWSAVWAVAFTAAFVRFGLDAGERGYLGRQLARLRWLKRVDARSG